MRHGFTLVELIVVMAMLSAVLAVSAPSLIHFFKGRSIVEESRRFLALTRYAQEQAISMAVPMEIWIDREWNRYGLLPMTGYEEYDDEKQFEYENDEQLTIELIQNYAKTASQPSILFLPDGTVDETSLDGVRFYNREEEESMYVLQSLFDPGFEVLTEEEYVQRQLQLPSLSQSR